MIPVVERNRVSGLRRISRTSARNGIRLFCILLGTVCALALLPPAARADCAGDIVSAKTRAMAFPATPGRAALLEQIQRAEVAHHEGDEDDCHDQIRTADDVLDQIDANKRRAAAHKP